MVSIAKKTLLRAASCIDLDVTQKTGSISDFDEVEAKRRFLIQFYKESLWAN